MAKNEKTQETALTTKNTADGVIVAPGDVAALREVMRDAGFADERTIVIGDPSQPGNEKRWPIYFGELLGPGGSLMVQTPGGKPDPTTGEVPMSELPIFLFNPINPDTLEPIRSCVDSIIASHAVANHCMKHHTLAQAQGGVAQLFLQFNGKVQTRRGNMLNDVSCSSRIVRRQEPQK